MLYLKSLPTWLAAVSYNNIGSVISLLIYWFSTAKGKTSLRGIVFVSLAGVAIMLLFFVLAPIFNKGGNLSYAIPTLYGTAFIVISSSVFAG